jgi:hypothetical protein
MKFLIFSSSTSSESCDKVISLECTLFRFLAIYCSNRSFRSANIGHEGKVKLERFAVSIGGWFSINSCLSIPYCGVPLFVIYNPMA